MINFNKLKKSDYLDRLTKRTYFQSGGKIFNSKKEADDYALKLKNQGYVVEPNGDGTFTAKKSTQVEPTTIPGSDIKIDIKSKPGDEDFKINPNKDEFIKQLLKSGWTREDLEANPGTLPLEDYDKFPSRSKPSEPLVESETFGFKNTTDNPKGIDLPYAIEEGSNTYVTGIENIEKLMRRMSETGSNKDLTKGTAAFRVNEDGTVDTSKPLRVYTKHLVFPAGRETALNNVTKQVEQKKMGFKPSGHGSIHENISDHSLPDKMKQGGTLKDRLLQCGGKMKKAGGTIKGKQHNLPDFLKKEIL